MKLHNVIVVCLLIGWAGGMFGGFWLGYMWRWRDETEEDVDGSKE